MTTRRRCRELGAAVELHVLDAPSMSSGSGSAPETSSGPTRQLSSTATTSGDGRNRSRLRMITRSPSSTGRSTSSKAGRTHAADASLACWPGRPIPRAGHAPGYAPKGLIRTRARREAGGRPPPKDAGQSPPFGRRRGTRRASSEESLCLLAAARRPARRVVARVVGGQFQWPRGGVVRAVS